MSDEPENELAGTNPIELGDLPTHGLPPIQFHESFGDPVTLMNSRDWLQRALESKGAKMIGGGCGMGQADIDILLDGCKFNISIRPIL